MKNMVASTSVTSFGSEEQEEQLSGIQNKLLKYIIVQPGIRYRELLRLSCLSNGVLSYHITNLEKSGQIIVDRNINNKITRYYPNNIPIEETSIIGHIRNNTSRHIILFILEHDLCTFNEIIEHTKKAPSTIYWHLKKLKDAGIISVLYTSHCQRLYKLTDIELVTNVLSKYKESFIDKVVNNYTDIIEGL
jgi:predicted transcriptional regulator